MIGADKIIITHQILHGPHLNKPFWVYYTHVKQKTLINTNKNNNTKICFVAQHHEPRHTFTDWMIA